MIYELFPTGAKSVLKDGHQVQLAIGINVPRTKKSLIIIIDNSNEIYLQNIISERMNKFSPDDSHEPFLYQT